MEVDYCNEVPPSVAGPKRYAHKEDVVPPRDLNELISELHKVFAADDVSVEYVQELMASYRSNPSDWKKFAKFDPHRYTRNLVDEGNGKFNLIVLCWNESQGSSIHDHANAHCFMKILDGQLQEQLYSWPEHDGGQMALQGVHTYDTDQVAYIHDKIGLHRVENPSNTNTAVSLHLYSPPFDLCQCFDERTGKCTKARVTFWSKYGERTPYQAHRLRHTQSCVSNNGGQAVGIGGPMRPGGGQCSCIRKGASSWPWCKAAEAVNTLSRDDEHMSVPNADVFEVCLRDSSNNVFPELCIGNMDEDEAIYYRDLCLAL